MLTKSLIPFVLVAASSTALWANPPEITAAVHILDVTYGEVHAEGRMAMRLCNITSLDMTNVNVRAPNGGGDRLDRGVVQFGHVAAGECKSEDARFVWQQLILNETSFLPLRIDYDIGGAHQDQIVHADRID